MGPSELSKFLRHLAQYIEVEERPSISHVATSIEAAIAILAGPDDAHPRSNKPAPPKPVPKPSIDLGPVQQKKPTFLPKTVNKKPDPGTTDESTKELRKLDRDREKMKNQMPEYASFEAFVRFMDESDRDVYTIEERNKFCEIHGISPDVFKTTMNGAGKYMLLNIPGTKIKAPNQVLEKAAKELGISAAEVKQFLNSFDDPTDIPVDSKPIVEAMTEWLAS